MTNGMRHKYGATLRMDEATAPGTENGLVCILAEKNDEGKVLRHRPLETFRVINNHGHFVVYAEDSELTKLKMDDRLLPLYFETLRTLEWLKSDCPPVRRVIALCGPMFCGKSYYAQTIKNMTKGESVIVPFAKSLKDIAKLFGWDGMKDLRGRRLLTDLGDVGRRYDPELYVKLWQKQAIHDMQLNNLVEYEPGSTRIIDKSSWYRYIVTDDLRYENELDGLFGLARILGIVDKRVWVVNISAEPEILEARAKALGAEIPSEKHSSEVGIPDLQKKVVARGGVYTAVHIFEKDGDPDAIVDLLKDMENEACFDIIDR